MYVHVLVAKVPIKALEWEHIIVIACVKQCHWIFIVSYKHIIQ